MVISCTGNVVADFQVDIFFLFASWFACFVNLRGVSANLGFNLPSCSTPVASCGCESKSLNNFARECVQSLSDVPGRGCSCLSSTWLRARTEERCLGDAGFIPESYKGERQRWSWNAPAAWLGVWVSGGVPFAHHALFLQPHFAIRALVRPRVQVKDNKIRVAEVSVVQGQLNDKIQEPAKVALCNRHTRGPSPAHASLMPHSRCSSSRSVENFLKFWFRDQLWP